MSQQEPHVPSPGDEQSVTGLETAPGTARACGKESPGWSFSSCLCGGSGPLLGMMQPPEQRRSRCVAREGAQGP